MKMSNTYINWLIWKLLHLKTLLCILLISHIVRQSLFIPFTNSTNIRFFEHHWHYTWNYICTKLTEKDKIRKYKKRYSFLKGPNYLKQSIVWNMNCSLNLVTGRTMFSRSTKGSPEKPSTNTMFHYFYQQSWETLGFFFHFSMNAIFLPVSFLLLNQYWPSLRHVSPAVVLICFSCFL